MAKSRKARADSTQRVTSIKLSSSARGKILRDLDIKAPLSAVPNAIQVVRMSRSDFTSKVATPGAWVLVIV